MSRLVVSILFLLMAVSPRAFAQGERVALVVGVAGYQHAPKLVNTLNDAEDMAAALRKLGFRVDLVLDPDRAALEAAVRRFGQMSVGAEASLFHYSGHAMEFGGKNWLVPTSANFDTGRNVRFEALELDSVLEQTDGNARVTVVFLDACRDNPFLNRLTARTREVVTRGLGRVEATASGVLLAFATAPGQVAQDGQGRNSPFTAAILKKLDTPGLEIKSLMTQVTRDVVEATGGRQRPWQNSSLEGDFYFRPAATATTADPGRGAATTTPSVDPEIIYWNSISSSNDPADFRAYLARFPNGLFSELARNRLIRLLDAILAETPKPPAQPAPPPVVAKVEPTQPARPAQPPVTQPAPPTPTPSPPPVVAKVEPPQPARPPQPSATQPAAPPASGTPRDIILAGLAAAAPQLAADRRDQLIRDYLASPGARAIAFVPGAATTWRRSRLPDEATAKTVVLEGCQIYTGRPCALLAVNDRPEVTPEGVSPLRDMPNVAYAGKFELAKIPVVSRETLRRPEVAGYLQATGSKAAAIDGAGHFHVANGAAGQAAAEQAALSACAGDPARAASNGPCFLYATGNLVVLPKRLTKPRPTPTNLAEAFDYANLSQDTLRAYSGEASFRALAVEPVSRRTYRVSGMASAERADEVALEGCQMYYGLPCVLFASGGDMRAPDIARELPRSMPRIAYKGPFDPAKIPGFRNLDRKEFGAYRTMPSPKAMAIRANGERVQIASGKDAVEAQTKALAACNDPDPAFPCFVYAINDNVVFSQRRPEPIR